MKLETLPDLEPKGKEVLIKIHACGVCFHDVVTRNGIFKRGVEMPIIPGHEIAGKVVAVGEMAKLFRQGDRVASTQRYHICGHCVYCRTGNEKNCQHQIPLGDVGLNGGYAEYVLVEEDNLALIPNKVSMEQAAVAACAIGTELTAIREVGQLKLGESVLITGAGGGIGIHGVQLAKRAGGYVIAVTTSANKVKPIREAGADEVILVAKGEDFSSKVKEVTGGHGADIAIDNVGSLVFTSVMRSLAIGGRWVTVGQLNGEFVSFNPAQLFIRNLKMLSAVNCSQKQLVDILEMINRGWIKPQIAGLYPLEDAPVVHAAMERGELTGRAVLTLNVE